MKLRKNISAALVTAFVLFAFVVGTAGRGQAASDALNNALGAIRNLGTIDFDDLVKWAKGGHPRPDNPTFSLENVEADIDRLHADDQSAVLSCFRAAAVRRCIPQARTIATSVHSAASIKRA